MFFCPQMDDFNEGHTKRTSPVVGDRIGNASMIFKLTQLISIDHNNRVE